VSNFYKFVIVIGMTVSWGQSMDDQIQGTSQEEQEFEINQASEFDNELLTLQLNDYIDTFQNALIGQYTIMAINDLNSRGCLSCYTIDNQWLALNIYTHMCSLSPENLAQSARKNDWSFFDDLIQRIVQVHNM
jgi:hypothetical protein